MTQMLSARYRSDMLPRISTNMYMCVCVMQISVSRYELLSAMTAVLHPQPYPLPIVSIEMYFLVIELYGRDPRIPRTC